LNELTKIFKKSYYIISTALLVCFLSVNFAVFNEVVSSLSAKPVAPVSYRSCFSPQIFPRA